MQETDVFFGLTTTDWTAVLAFATIGLVIATAALAWVAGYQISAARTEAIAVHEESKRNRTLDVVSKYDHDPVLDRALRRLARARDNKTLYNNTMPYRTDIVAIMNYFESIAIGLKQDLFILEMVRDYMEPIFRSHIEEIVREKLFEKIKADPDDFEHICALNESWKPKHTVHYKGDRA